MKKRDFLKLSVLSLAPLTLPGISLANSDKTGTPPGFPKPQFINANGIRMAVYERGQGLPVIFCHGFPELAYSWRHLLDSVSAAGFRAIAPDLRGFGLTDKPESIDAYAATEICDDLVGMMDTMDLAKAVFCGHDWGGFIVDTMTLLYPERCAGLVGIGAPHQYRPEDLPPVGLKVEEIIDKPAYNAFMQQPDLPEKLLNGDVKSFFNTLFRKNYLNTDYLKKLPVDSPERRLDLAEMMRNSRGDHELIVSDRELKFYVETFERTGLTGGINWYRAMDKSWEEITKRELHWGLKVPYLYLWPEEDPINVLGLDVGLEDYITDLEKHPIKGSGHFVMEDKPEALSRLITGWLVRKFGDTSSLSTT